MSAMLDKMITVRGMLDQVLERTIGIRGGNSGFSPKHMGAFAAEN